ncbi:ferritin-like catalase Nec2 [Tasmannia lanceolata]|uniref:ferritin-like catalase Nec2 n=1 Tax=Tasmannia lanceolata TaxID=3420 RepID=UPI004063C56D
MGLIFLFLFFSLESFLYTKAQSPPPPPCDVELLQFALNLEYLEAEFFLFGALGYGLDRVEPELAMGGPPPVGGRQASLSWLVRDIVIQFAYQEVGHLRAIRQAVGAFPRPLLNLSSANFARLMDNALGQPLIPPFDPYISDLNFLIACYLIPYIGLTGYAGTAPYLNSSSIKSLVAGLLAVESGQDAVIRTLLYQTSELRPYPYSITVAELTDAISVLRNRLAHSTNKDHGVVIIPPTLQHGWDQGWTRGNIIDGDNYSVAFSRTPQEILRIVYGSGLEYVTGGFFPAGADGTMAKIYLPGTYATSACPEI